MFEVVVGFAVPVVEESVPQVSVERGPVQLLAVRVVVLLPVGETP